MASKLEGSTELVRGQRQLDRPDSRWVPEFPVDERGFPLKGNARHPLVEDDVVVHAGGTILGRITIGEGSIAGGNAWVTRSVRSESQVTQAQAHSHVFEHGSRL